MEPMRNEIPLYPPLEWFSPPTDMPADAGCMIDNDGRVYGYLCHWDSILMDGRNDRWTPPRSRSDYSYAHTGDTKLADGTIIKTANLGGDLGHAPQGGGDISQTQDFYENTQTQLARIRYGEDENGVWFAGACWPTVTEFEIAKLRASARSGHWAVVGDWKDIRSGRTGYELVGACLVNVPGLKYARADRAASGILSFNPIHNPMRATNRIEVPRNVMEAIVTLAKHYEPIIGASPQESTERVASASATVEMQIEDGAAEQRIGGVLVVEDAPTEDGRLLRAGSVEWRELPLPLYSSLENLPGHDSADLIGRIDSITRGEGGQILYEGVIIAAASNGAGSETIEAIRNEMLTGVSIDGIVGPEDAEYLDDGTVAMDRIVIAGATLTPMPAIQEASVTLLSSDTEDFQMDEEEIAEEVVEQVADESGTDDQFSALSEKLASVSDRVEYLISLVEAWQMSSRHQAALKRLDQ